VTDYGTPQDLTLSRPGKSLQRRRVRLSNPYFSGTRPILRPLRILYLEDELNDVQLVTSLLLESEIEHDLIHVNCREDFIAALESELLDLILADYSLPGFDGMSALAIAREKLPDTPFILVSGQLGEEVAVEALRAGAADYVLKRRINRLVPVVIRAMLEKEAKVRNHDQTVESKRLATAIESTADAVVITDVEGRILFVNQAFEDITGFRRQEVMRQNPRILKSGHHDQAFYQDMWRTVLDGKVWTGSVINMKRNGELYEEEMTISPIRGSSGRVENFVAVKRDVTEQQKLKQKLLQAQKLEALGVLSAGIAHDFNNILACIMGYGQLVAAEIPPDSTAFADQQQVLAAAERAKELVTQILSFSRKRNSTIYPIRPHLVINETLKLLRPGLTPSLDISTKIDKNCGAVMCDPTHLHQILMNLCTNAYHAMNGNGGRVTVGLESYRADDAFRTRHADLKKDLFSRLYVADTGQGMDQATLDQVFDPFFTTKPFGEGTGLGLATVQSIVEAQGGVIEVDSKPGFGTRFDIYLPTVDINGDLSTASTMDLPGGTERILVIEEETPLAELIERQLNSLGYAVVVHGGTLTALDDLSRHPGMFDLVLTDVNIAGAIIPVLPIRCASPETCDPIEAMNCHVGRPFSIQELAQKIRNALDNVGDLTLKRA
jgi:PAS domain S-box-containing protein